MFNGVDYSIILNMSMAFFTYLEDSPRLVPVSSFGLLNQAKGSTIGTRCKLVPVVAGRLGDWAA